MGKPKKPYSAFAPKGGKNVRGTSSADHVPTMHFRWSTETIDLEGPFGWKNLTAKFILQELLPKLHSFEQMTWAEVDGPTGSHFVSVSDIAQAAKNRLPQIGMEDVDELFSLRISGKVRIWGIRDIAVLRILWWDPEHKVCPSKKKHT